MNEHPYVTKILALCASINLSNNGYLFAPKDDQIELAKENPKIFKYTFNSANTSFPHKIELTKS